MTGGCGTRMGVSVEESGVQQLFEVADHSQVDQLLDVVGVALAQLLPLQPGGGEHPPRR